MRHFYSKPLAAVFLIAFCRCASANAIDGLLADYDRVTAQGSVTHQVDIDNDTLLFNRNDGFYTSGMRYTQLSALRDAGSTTTFGWRLGQDLYTASDIKLPPEQVGPPDHPYAGWLYGGFFRQVEHADGTHVKLGIDLGCLGRCAGGEWTQTNFHRLINQPLPQGWSKQVKNEVGADIDRHKIALERPIKDTGEHDVAIKLHHDVTAQLVFQVKSAAEPKADAAPAAAPEDPKKRRIFRRKKEETKQETK